MLAYYVIRPRLDQMPLQLHGSVLKRGHLREKTQNPSYMWMLLHLFRSSMYSNNQFPVQLSTKFILAYVLYQTRLNADLTEPRPHRIQLNQTHMHVHLDAPSQVLREPKLPNLSSFAIMSDLC